MESAVRQGVVGVEDIQYAEPFKGRRKEKGKVKNTTVASRTDFNKAVTSFSASRITDVKYIKNRVGASTLPCFNPLVTENWSKKLFLCRTLALMLS